MTNKHVSEGHTTLPTANDGTLARVNGANKAAAFYANGTMQPVLTRKTVHQEQRTRNLKVIDGSTVSSVDIRTLIKPDTYEFLRQQQQAHFATLYAKWSGRPIEPVFGRFAHSQTTCTLKTLISEALGIDSAALAHDRRNQVYLDIVELDKKYVQTRELVDDPTNFREKKFRTARSRLLKSYIDVAETEVVNGVQQPEEQKLRQDVTPKTLTKQIKSVLADYKAAKNECAEGWNQIPNLMEYFDRLLRLFKRLGRIANKIRSHKKYDKRVILQTKYTALKDFTRFAAMDTEGFMKFMELSPLAAPFTKDVTLDQLKGMSEFSLLMVLQAVSAPGLTFTVDVGEGWSYFYINLDVDESEITTLVGEYTVDVPSTYEVEVPEERLIDQAIHVAQLFARQDVVFQVLTEDVEETYTSGESRPDVPSLLRNPPTFVFHSEFCNPPTRRPNGHGHLSLLEQRKRVMAISRILEEARIAFAERDGKHGNRQRKPQKSVKPKVSRDYDPTQHQALYQSRPGLRLPPKAINRWAWKPHPNYATTSQGVSCGVETYMNPKERDSMIKCHILDVPSHVRQMVESQVKRYYKILKLYTFNSQSTIVSLIMRKFIDLEILEFATTSSGWTEKSNFHKKSKAPKLYAVFRDETQDVKVRDIITRKPVDRMLCGNFSQVLIETNKEVWSRVSGLKFPVLKGWNSEDLMSLRYCVQKQSVYVDRAALLQVGFRALMDLSLMLKEREDGGLNISNSVKLTMTKNWDRTLTRTSTATHNVLLSSLIEKYERRSVPVLAMHKKDLATWSHDDWTAVCGEINRNLFKELHGTI